MKIEIIGGGPAGLYFSLLMKKADPSHQIKIYEQNQADDTFGFGVVFSAETLGHFRDYDQVSYDRIRRTFAYWDDIVTYYKGSKIAIGGNGFCGMSRKDMLLILQDCCREVGIEMEFQREITSLQELNSDADIILAANGINSWVRDEFVDHFKPRFDWRPNKFVWLGSTKPLPAFTFDFRENDAGIWNLHAYQYNSEMSTMIVETTEEAWRKAGMENATEEETVAYVSDLYKDLLDGHPIITNRSVWRNFPMIRCETWVKDNLVIMGDCAHTAHYSIGSGTKLAMEDAIALFECCKAEPNPRKALKLYDDKRRDEVERTQHAADVSLSWFENVRRYWGMDPIQFNFSLMSRSKAITYDNLRLRDREFVRSVDKVFSEQVAEKFNAPQLKKSHVPPMFAPLELRDMRLSNRVVVSPMCQYCATEGNPDDWHFSHYTSRAMGGAGLVFTEMTCISPNARITPGCVGIWTDEQETQWKRIVDFVHHRTGAKMAMQIGHAGRKGATKLAWEGIDQPLDEGAWEIIAASPLPYLSNSAVPREMTRDDMDRVKSEFVAGFERAARAGFDMAELHCAHGYVLATFLSPFTNRRTDEYGGSLPNRLRYPLEVFDACRAVWPEERPMSVRISATDWVEGGTTSEDAVEFAKAFKARGCDLINVSTGQTDSSEKPVYGRMFQVPFSEQIRIEADISTMVAGNIFDWDQVNTIVGSGRSDLVALARTHLYNPYFTQQAAAYYGVEDIVWPDQYMSAKFAAFRQYERNRLQMEELREQAKPDNEEGKTGGFDINKVSEWEMKGAAVGAAGGSRTEAAE
ncbi:MAG: Salicyloyl-CoA 5-hydroxylase [Alphaproteobacteria bacterium MarineAlpha11_Bin1]|nr:MAG: Salicyloyl-CoA 5-hydroxylase [Alphaproteobacteria bacterium MarineAlpha11_Bin1]|tara:strand:+ start:16740 stop:19157 length:2418 start_codon:yes stop_codon:yes gene_type:complete